MKITIEFEIPKSLENLYKKLFDNMHDTNIIRCDTDDKLDLLTEVIGCALDQWILDSETKKNLKNARNTPPA